MKRDFCEVSIKLGFVNQWQGNSGEIQSNVILTLSRFGVQNQLVALTMILGTFTSELFILYLPGPE